MSAREPSRPLASPEATRRSAPPAGEREREYDLLLRDAPHGISVTQGVLGILVRLLGLALLIVGLIAAVAVLVEAWKLYQAPERMERFAVAIERGSNLDKIFALPAEGGAEVATGSAAGDEDRLRLSYFVAWFVVLLMLLIVSIIALSTVSAGGRLALYDTDVRQLSKAVVREVRRRK